MEIRIDDEFKSLIPPLTEEEFKQLEQNIIAEGCRDALVVWDNTIIDGHNRYKICTKHNIEYKIVKPLPPIEAGASWFIDRSHGGLTRSPQA